MKRILFLLLAAAAFASCNDDGTTKIKYASENTAIVNGVFTSDNMHFYGTATVTDSEGGTYSDPEAWFEFAGSSETLVLYMHQTRFAAAMPALDMRIYQFAYTPGEGASLSFEVENIIPQVRLPNEVGGGYSYQPMPSYTLSDVEGSIDNTLCRVAFTCTVPRLGTYRMEYEGLLLEKGSI